MVFYLGGGRKREREREKEREREESEFFRPRENEKNWKINRKDAPTPPSLRSVWIQARCENCESTETPRIWVLSFSKSGARSEKAVISVEEVFEFFFLR